MLANDFVRPVSFDAFGARIPADHLAARVEHVDRVIGHTSNEDAKLFLALTQSLLSRPPLRQVAGDLGEADEFHAAPDRINHDVGPEPGAVLAESPALSLKPPRFSSGCKCTLRKPCLPVLRRIELREMHAEDFFGGIPLEALRSGVPAVHVPCWVEHVDCVVCNGLN